MGALHPRIPIQLLIRLKDRRRARKIHLRVLRHSYRMNMREGGRGSCVHIYV